MCLIVGEKHPQAERTLSFVARFTTADKREKETLSTNKKEGEEGKGNTSSNKSANDTLQEGQGDVDKTLNSTSAQGTSSAVNDSVVALDDEGDEEVDPFLVNMFQFLLNVSLGLTVVNDSAMLFILFFNYIAVVLAVMQYLLVLSINSFIVVFYMK